MQPIQRQSEQWPDRTAAIQAAQEHHLQEPHYYDYGPEENDWEAQREAMDYDPGPEPHEVDTHYDPDHGREDRFGAQNVHNLSYPRDPDDVVPGSPQDHAQHLQPSGGPYSPEDDAGHRRDYNPYAGYEPTPWEEHQSELAADDDDSGYNWGPPPPEHFGRVAGGYGTGKTEAELAAAHPHPVQQHDDIQIMRGVDTGLYGEDEDHPQDIIGQPNQHGGYDVIRHLPS
jgi:hypothetical protein